MDGTNLGIEASCGISLAPDHGNTADLLLQRADVAMYVAKDSQASVVVYTEDLNVNTPARLSLLGDLRNATAGNEFVLHYQPKASMRPPGTGRRGPDPLATPDARPPVPGQLHPRGRAHRTDRADDRVGAQRRAATVPSLARPWQSRHPRELSIAVNLSTRSLLDVSPPERCALPSPGGTCLPTSSISRSPRRSS